MRRLLAVITATVALVLASCSPPSRNAGAQFVPAGMAAAPTFTVIYAFGSKPGDGDSPRAPLIVVNGTLYGTTQDGGKYGYGTVFSLTPKGEERVLHSFGAGDDGRWPTADLVDDRGVLYGTTVSGGANCPGRFPGCGTVFGITLSGAEHVVYSFAGGDDGDEPRAGLALLRGDLYGTTERGGKFGDGTIFAITAAGRKTVLHSFDFR
ncbi:MAG: hypothetical protein JO199_01845, partial [Candidatus Eremiobacteraeota bacterium]|nr:hypothetical protein [Candidatus Eremiobacteraeota bacterium]